MLSQAGLRAASTASLHRQTCAAGCHPPSHVTQSGGLAWGTGLGTGIVVYALANSSPTLYSSRATTLHSKPIARPCQMPHNQGHKSWVACKALHTGTTHCHRPGKATTHPTRLLANPFEPSWRHPCSQKSFGGAPGPKGHVLPQGF